MSKPKICPGKADSIWAGGKAEGKPRFFPGPGGGRGWFVNDVGGGYYYNSHEYIGIKRIKMKCEICGRRVYSSVWNNGDGDLLHVLPPHKIKHWWKGKKARWQQKRN